MKLSRKVISSLLVISLVSGGAATETKSVDRGIKGDDLSHLFDFERKSFQKIYASLPPVIRNFEHLDFDARMEQQEYLRLKYKDQLFMDTLRYRLLKGNSDVEAFMMASEIVALGRPAITLKTNSSMRDVAEKCGLKRLCRFFDSIKKDKTPVYPQNQYDKGALLAEMMALDEAGPLFEVMEQLNLKKAVLKETEKTEVNSSSNSYHQVILKRAKERLDREYQLYARNPTREQG